MNHTYRLIWSHRSHCFVAVGEHARRCGKSVRGAGLVIAAVLATAIFPASCATAGPTGGVINGTGAGSITRPDAITTVINQVSPRLAIDWTSFSSAEGEKIQFVQPNASAIALNRVIGRTPSELLGNLTATGQVFVINPNGVLFGEKASVSVGGLVASTLQMDPNKFLGGSQVLEGGGIGSVINRGKLTAVEGDTPSNSGYIALVGPRVINEGTITAVQGKVLMAAGDSVTLTLAGRSLASYTINRGSLDALVDNRLTGILSANGGEVTLDARAADKLSQAVVNHTGVIEAQTLRGNRGSIQLLGGIKSGDMEAGDMYVAGKLDVSAPAGGDGGSVKTSAARVNISALAQVNLLPQEFNGNKGTWTNTSRDFLIAEGNGPQTSSSIGAKTLETNLEKNSQVLTTPNVNTGKGSLYVNAPVAWNADNGLSLQASQSIFFNANIGATQGKLELRYNQSNPSAESYYYLGKGVKISLPAGENFTLYASQIFADPIKYMVITALGGPQSVTGKDLQGISNGVNSGRYVLGDDIDASATRQWNNGAGFVPLGGFQGTLDGLGHSIKNLFIKSAATTSVGLIRDMTSSGRIQNLVLENADVTNTRSSSVIGVGTLVGINDGKISNVHATMSVKSSADNTGGLVGINNGNIEKSSAVGDVGSYEALPINAIGGLVGKLAKKSKIIDSYAIANVTGNRNVGGLVGYMEKTGNEILGPNVRGSYAGAIGKGSVRGKENVGGLVGYLEFGGVTDSYAAVPVTGTGGDAIGGLVGLLQGVVERTYATGRVMPGGANPVTVGGLIGVNKASGGKDNVINSFWNKDTTDQASSQGSENENGLTTAQMRSLFTFGDKGAQWNIDAESGTGKTWRIYDGQTAPLLRSFLVTKDVETKSVTYNTEMQIGCTGTPCDSASGNTTFTAASGQKVGTYTPYDSQQGYDIRGGKLTITPFLLTPTTDALEKVYDGTVVAPGRQLQIQPLGRDNVIANYASAAYDSKNAGDNKTVTFSGITLEGGDEIGNYEIPGMFGFRNGKITPLTLSLSGTEVANKVYDGSKVARVSNIGTLDRAIQGDDIRVNAGGAEFNDKNVAQKKTVTVSGLTLAGADAGNYLLDRTTVTANADITPLTLSLSGTEVAGKVYDGKATATLTKAGTLANGIGNDVVTLNATGASAAFADKNVGKDKVVTVSGLALQGADAGNYRIADPSARGSITARALSLSKTEVADKVYDGSTVATLTNAGTLKDVVANDDVKTTTTGVTATFADKNAGQNKTVTVSNLSLTGADAANYVLNSTQAATATILPRPLAVRAQGVDKIYDGNTNATVTLGDNRIAGDKFDLLYAKASFANSNAGSGKTVAVAGIAASGADAGNYVADTNAVTTASVSKAPLTITANPDSKAFDGKAYRGGNGVTYAGFVAGENAAVLNGQPSYGGDAQGAVNIGSYRIAPGGYASQNYAIVYVDGKLTIQQPPLEPVYQAAGTEVAATAAAMSDAATNPNSMRLLSQQATLRVAECGTRLPERPLAVVADCNEGRASTNAPGSVMSAFGF